jgi:hypothetical protein
LSSGDLFSSQFQILNDARNCCTDIGVRSICKKCGYEDTAVGNGCRAVCAVQDVVLKETTEETSVSHESADRSVWNLGKRAVRRRKDGDVLCRRERSDEPRNQVKEGAQLRQLSGRVQGLCQCRGLLSDGMASKGEDGELLDMHDVEEDQ